MESKLLDKAKPIIDLYMLLYMLSVIITYYNPLVILLYTIGCADFSDEQKELFSILLTSIIFALIEHLIIAPQITYVIITESKKICSILLSFFSIFFSIATIAINYISSKYLYTYTNCENILTICDEYIPKEIMHDRIIDPCKLSRLNNITMAASFFWLIYSIITFVCYIIFENDIPSGYTQISQTEDIEIQTNER